MDGGHLRIINFLNENGFDIHCDNEEALRNACHWGHLIIVKYLIENGANIHAMNDEAFCGACEGHLDIAMYLVKNGANINANHNYAFKIATKNNHTKIVNFLVELGMDKYEENTCVLF